MNCRCLEGHKLDRRWYIVKANGAFLSMKEQSGKASTLLLCRFYEAKSGRKSGHRKERHLEFLLILVCYRS